MVETITHYTAEEGGEWLPMPEPFEVSRCGDLNPVAYSRHFPAFVMLQLDAGHLRLHSFRTSAGGRWDAVNGWRHRP